METFNEYSKEAYSFAFAKDESKLPIYLLGLSGEVGEVHEKFKKMYRDNEGQMSAEFKQEVAKELGDVLWYINSIAQELDISLEDIANKNLNKLGSRKDRGVQHGSGDNR